MTRWILVLALVAEAAPAGAAVGVRVLLGVGDQEETDWSGGVSARGASIAAVEPWRFDAGDAMQSDNKWKMKSRRIRVFAGAPAPILGTAPSSWSQIFTPPAVHPRPVSSHGV